MKETLRERFEPSVLSDVYKAELQCWSKQRSGSWGDYADKLCLLVDKAYSNLEENAREFIALNSNLSHLSDLHIVLSIKQCHPKTLLKLLQLL